MPLLRHIGIWIRAVLAIWQSYVTGGVIVLLLLLYEKFRLGTISNVAWKYGLIGFLLVSLFTTWRRERVRVESYENTAFTRLLVSNASWRGSSLSATAPGETDSKDEVNRWTREVESWQDETRMLLNSLSPIAANKFSQIHDSNSGVESGYAPQIAAIRGIVNKQIQNLSEIMEKPETYLARVL